LTESPQAPPWLTAKGDRLLLDVYVQPRASRDRVVGEHGELLKVQVGAPPVDDAANHRLVELLAQAFGVHRSAVRILTGARGRRKRVEVRGAEELPAWVAGDPRKRG
jgi:uncharacterized protein (TIGR00251 family)